MKTNSPTTVRIATRSRLGFSLIEILVTVALLSFIILGLLAMFHQTQRAFRGSITQSDVLESGRALTDMLAREIEQMTPSHMPHLTNGTQFSLVTNFFAEPSFGFFQPLIQNLPGTAAERTNLVQRFFFLTRQNLDWTGVGYQVIPEDVNAGAGALYRFRSPNGPSRDPRFLSAEFEYWSTLASQRAQLGWPLTNLPFYRVADGVVHLRARALAPNGFPLTQYQAADGYWTHQPNRPDLIFKSMRNVDVYGNAYDPSQIMCYLVSNAVPASVEIELGIIEPQIMQRFKALGTVAAQRDYLSNRVAHVQLFRQQIPVRNVDLTVYQ